MGWGVRHRDSWCLGARPTWPSRGRCEGSKSFSSPRNSTPKLLQHCSLLTGPPNHSGHARCPLPGMWMYPAGTQLRTREEATSQAPKEGPGTTAARRKGPPNGHFLCLHRAEPRAELLGPPDFKDGIHGQASLI